MVGDDPFLGVPEIPAIQNHPGCGSPPRFVVGPELGRLARWLRILGFDARLEKTRVRSEDLAGETGGGVLLTRSAGIGAEARDVVVIHADRVFAQLREVIHALAITPDMLRLFSRCTLCNALLKAVDKDRIRGDVPDYVWENHHRFQRCPICRRIYWQGTHARRTRKTAMDLFAPGPPPPAAHKTVEP